MSKIVGLGVLAGVLAACTLTEIPPAFTEQEIAALCQAAGHRVGTDPYEACLDDQRAQAFVRDIVKRHGGISGFDRTYRKSR